MRRSGALTGLNLALLLNVWALGGVSAQAQTYGFYTRVREQSSLEANESIAVNGLPMPESVAPGSRTIMVLETQATAEPSNRRMLANAKKSNVAVALSGALSAKRRLSTVASRYVMGTQLTLYTQPRFGVRTGGVFAVIKAAFPKQCFNLVKPFAGDLESVRVKWNIKDNKPNHVVCGQVIFWDDTDCYGNGWYLEVPGGWDSADPKKFTYSEYNVPQVFAPDSKIRSFECAYHPKKPGCPDPCAKVKCKADSVCVREGCGSACFCKLGYVNKSGKCVKA